MIITFKMHCIPPKATHQASLRIMKRKDGTQFVGKFAKSKGKVAQSDLMTLLAPHVPERPIESPVAVSVVWEYPYRKSEKKRNIGKIIPCDTRPDCDNLSKMLFDCMTRLGFWNDDSQIYDLRFKKVWGMQPGIEIKIEECLK